MPSWKKLLQSGSDAHLSTVTASQGLRVSSIQFDDGVLTSAGEAGGAQNLFSTISSSGASTTGSFSADSATDTLTFQAGDNIHISASNDVVFISSSGGGGGVSSFNDLTDVPDFIKTNNTASLTNITASTDVSASGTGSFGRVEGISSADTSVLQSDLTTSLTSAVGTISSGDTFAQGTSIEAILRSMLIAYIPPTLGTLSIKFNTTTRGTTILDVGNSFTCNKAVFNANPDSIGDLPENAKMTLSGTDSADFSNRLLASTLSTSNNLDLDSGATITVQRATDDGTVTFTLTTESQTTSDTQSKSKSYFFRWRNYLAASTTTISSDSDLQSVLNNDVVDFERDTNRSWQAECTSENTSKFTYIIYPNDYSDLTGVIQDGATPVLSAFTKVGDFTAENEYNASRTWRVYKSNSEGAFSSGTTLTIS